MKNRISMVLGLAIVVFLAGSVSGYTAAETSAAQWKMLARQYQDTDKADTDGLSQEEVHGLVTQETSGSSDLSRWPLSGGVESLVVLELRLRQHTWWRAWTLCDRIIETGQADTVCDLAGAVQVHLRNSVACASLALVMLCALGLVTQRMS